MNQPLALTILTSLGLIFSPSIIQAQTTNFCRLLHQTRICHNSQDESIFYQTPSDRIAYNVQTIVDDRNPNNLLYITVYHSEPKGKAAGTAGDSIRLGTNSNPYSYTMPADTNYIIWGDRNDTGSFLYSPPSPFTAATSGGANPIMISGPTWENDPYIYLFFLSVEDDDHDRQDEADFRHYLHMARTTDYQNFELYSNQNGSISWRPYNPTACSQDPTSCRPAILYDSQAKPIRSHNPTSLDSSQGLIGSMIIINQSYYFFYTDYAPETNDFHLYARTTQDLVSWSTALQITQTPLTGTPVIRVSVNRQNNHFVVITNCYRPAGSQDLCLYLTPDLDLDSLTSLDFTPNGYVYSNLNLHGSGDEYDSFAQPYLLTNLSGHLTVPESESSNPNRAGELRWTDMVNYENGQPKYNSWGALVYRAGFEIYYPQPTTVAEDSDQDLDVDIYDYLHASHNFQSINLFRSIYAYFGQIFYPLP